MGRAFTAAEKQQIEQRLLEVGRALFTRYGLKKTSIEDLTGPVGIAKSSFYLFFESKEALYLALLMQEGAGVEERVLRASFRSAESLGMREQIAGFIRAVIHEIETNELTRRLVTHPEELDLLARHLTPEQIAAKNRSSILLLLPFIQQGQAAGTVVPGDPEIIAGAIRAVTLLVLHKDTIGVEAYPAVVALLIDLVAGGLTCGDGVTSL